ncbi:glyoxalase [Entomobacter blattae]|uniref:Glyoxalase n=1 Tax=Entomobacter blattae TaxID=2762277 RepID=A0A7H1NSG9_9PROT|nr:glyoxalase [Entomobacter blattae]QNT78729.1 hypothetical protein JGUZn3_15060 [Entomobacter blattae]
MKKRGWFGYTALALMASLSFVGNNSAIARTGDAEPAQQQIIGGPILAVGPQYDTTHVYISPNKRDDFVKSFLGTFGGTSTKTVVATVTPTPSSTTSQLLFTPVGTLSVFGFKTPIPYPFGQERTGYLVTDMDKAIDWAQKNGAYVVVAPFNDPIGRDAVIQWPGGVNMQIYWHFKSPSYKPLHTIPENRIYLTPRAAEAFVKSFVTFSRGRVVSDESAVSGVEIGRPDTTFRRIRLESGFGKVVVLVTEGFLPYPYGHEISGYEVTDFDATIRQAKDHGVKVLAGPYTVQGQKGAILEFPGAYIAEIHTATP